MSRVFDALRRAGQAVGVAEPVVAAVRPVAPPVAGGLLMERIEEIARQAVEERILIGAARPHEPPSEEFRTLRTRLNHLQTQQVLHTVVVTSPSPAEGKSFAAVNLAMAEAQLDGNRTILLDCDFRRPVVHTFFGMQRGPGIADYLSGKAELHEVIKKIAGTNLYVMTAGEAVSNPLELLNRREVKLLLDQLQGLFNWVILDSPPLLFAADASLLSTLCHGTIMVVRIGSTTIDSVTRAMQSLCHNNVIGTVVNAARRRELYSKYTYYHEYAREVVAPAPPPSTAPEPPPTPKARAAGAT